MDLLSALFHLTHDEKAIWLSSAAAPAAEGISVVGLASWIERQRRREESWIVSISGSLAKLSLLGPLHPNTRGQMLYRRLIWNHLKQDLHPAGQPRSP